MIISRVARLQSGMIAHPRLINYSTPEMWLAVGVISLEKGVIDMILSCIPTAAPLRAPSRSKQSSRVSECFRFRSVNWSLEEKWVAVLFLAMEDAFHVGGQPQEKTSYTPVPLKS